MSARCEMNCGWKLLMTAFTTTALHTPSRILPITSSRMGWRERERERNRMGNLPPLCYIGGLDLYSSATCSNRLTWCVLDGVCYMWPNHPHQNEKRNERKVKKTLHPHCTTAHTKLLYLSCLVCDALQYPLNGWHIEMDVLLQVKTLDGQRVLNMVCVPLQRNKNKTYIYIYTHTHMR